jgi:GntR family transcriptional regulator
LDASIRRTGKVPLYEQVRVTLLDQIMRGQLRPGDQLPTERELCELFGVSRITAVRALNELARDGLIERIQGKGTIVARHRIDGVLDRIVSFSESIREQGLALHSRLLIASPVGTDPQLLPAFGLPPDSDARFMHFRRLRSVDDCPVVLLDSFVREELGEKMKAYDLETASFYQLYAQILDRKIVRLDATLSPVLATDEIVELLHVEKNSPHTLFEGVSYVEGETCVEYARGVFHGQRIRFTTNICSFVQRVELP